MQIKKLLKNKKVLIGLIIVIILIAALVITLVVKNNKKNNNEVGYYYNFVADDNLVTQSVKVYNQDDVLQTNYYLFYDGNPVSYTTGESAVVTIARVDLNDKPKLEICFSKDTDQKYEVEYRKD